MTLNEGKICTLTKVLLLFNIFCDRNLSQNSLQSAAEHVIIWALSQSLRV